VAVQPAQSFPVVFAVAAQTEATADIHRAVPARQVELVHGLRVQPRGEAPARGGLATVREHVRRDVAAVDVEAGAQVRKQQPAGAARDVERRLAVLLDKPLEVRDLLAADVELRPPLRHNTVVPGGFRHARTVRRSAELTGLLALPGWLGHMRVPWFRAAGPAHVRVRPQETVEAAGALEGAARFAGGEAHHGAF
jgi:hypothetical protein